MLTNQGFKLVATLLLLSVASTTIAVYRPLTLSVYVITLFVLIYALFAQQGLKAFKPNDFAFVRKLSKVLPTAGEKFDVSVSVVNRSGRRVRVMVIDSADGLRLVGGTLTAEKTLDPDDFLEIQYSLAANARGIYRIGPLKVRVSDDQGLVCKYFILEDEMKVTVVSAGVERPRLSEAVKKVKPTLFSGSGSSYEQGVDDVFRELTVYEEGQPLKAIDWRRSAREDGEIYVRKYDKLNLLRVLFLIDCSLPNSVGSPSLLDSCITAVSGAAMAMCEKGDLVTVATIGASTPGVYRISRIREFEGLVKFLASIVPGKSSDILEEVKQFRGYDVVFMLGRYVWVRGELLRAVFEHFRRNGAIVFLLVPLADAQNKVETILNQLEKHRIESLKQYTGYVFGIQQTELTSHLTYLHKTLRMTA
ncbi:MAG: DUF58 domain-containing protein [Candidatus Caldarchaeum sp.]